MKEQQSVKELIDMEPEPNQDVKPVITQGEDQVVAAGMASEHMLVVKKLRGRPRKNVAMPDPSTPTTKKRCFFSLCFQEDVPISYLLSFLMFEDETAYRDPNHECFRKLLEAPAIEAEQLVSQRIPVPKLVKCEQHISQARFLLAKLNPSATHKSSYVDGSEVRMTDDVSL
ncbi:protein transport protein Sec23 [Tanacetum coccineum]